MTMAEHNYTEEKSEKHLFCVLLFLSLKELNQSNKFFFLHVVDLTSQPNVFVPFRLLAVSGSNSAFSLSRRFFDWMKPFFFAEPHE